MSSTYAKHPVFSVSPETRKDYQGHFRSEHFKKIAQEFFSAGSTPQSVTFFYNPTENLGINERGVDRFIEFEEQALRELGAELSFQTVNWANLESLRSVKTDFAFHLCDGCGFDGEPGSEVMVTLESSQVPFSGVGSAVHQLTNDKFAMKLALKRAGVPVPQGFVAASRDMTIPEGISYPMFVKPRFGFGSILIDSASCARTEVQLRKAIGRVVDGTGTDALIEEYIEGREITVGVMGSGTRVLVLPPLEIRFGESYANIPKIRMESTKSDPNSKYYWDFKVDCPATLSPEVLHAVESVALRAYQAVGGDGYGRVDMRLTPEGVPYVIEVNGNPCLDYGDNPYDSGIFPLIALGTGWDYRTLIAHVVGAGALRSIRNYRQPSMTLRRMNGETGAYATRNLRAGTAVCGTLTASPSAEDTSALVGIDPYCKALGVSATPNTDIQISDKGALFVTTRGVRAHERLTISSDLQKALQARRTSKCPKSW